MRKSEYIELCRRQIALWQWALEQALKEDGQAPKAPAEEGKPEQKKEPKPEGKPEGKPEPPTEKQAEFLKKHGYKVPDDKKTASKWIDNIIKRNVNKK